MYFKPAMLVSALFLSSFSAHAELSSYNQNGVELVYSSVSDVTWTKDANLFKTMYDADNSLISKIAAATTSYNDSYFGYRTLDKRDFNTTYGIASWWGGQAFVGYLNSISYGGSNQWYLPTVVNNVSGINLPTNGTVTGDEFAELFYQELGGIGWNSIPDTAIFDNENSWVFGFWSGTEHEVATYRAWGFDSRSGFQNSNRNKDFQRYIWAVTPGQVTTVPEASTYAMLLAGLTALGLAIRRYRA
ncbi:PEP-CTERM sorting domain-containing protein [Methylobacillus methanolivorans]|uniref:PEP-CTERM sorting domain-containing protein n=1 Tax=Methylobacillus methanolivorans TaxID=1848927 RepID=A0ABW8GL24_9PROT